MKILFLSRYQNKLSRGAENFVKELTLRVSKKNQVDIFADVDADSLSKIIKGKYDLVISINGRLQAFLASLGRLLGGYKLLTGGHSGIGLDDIWNIAFVRPNIFVALTEHQRAWDKKWGFGIKIIKIPNGIDLEKFSPNGPKIDLNLPRPIILSVGALTWYKYHSRVIRAMREIGEGSILIVGEGGEKENLENLGKRYLGERFKIANFDYDDMPKVYRSCDLFTLPSWSREAFGIVYLEAMASGLGVVAPDDAPRHEIIGDAGIFVDVGDADRYAEALDKALSIDWSKKARDQAEQFSWDKIAKEYERVFEELVSH
ncbi:MAG: glycosyltransferase family 4 protein [Patescibacteria group bacterium]